MQEVKYQLYSRFTDKFTNNIRDEPNVEKEKKHRQRAITEK